MALESASYIDGLNSSNPAATDLMAQADDHIRMLKAVLKNTFPNINAPVTQTPNMLNNGVVPIGGVIMWSGAANAVPSGWKLCDGTTHVRSDGAGNITVPNLTNRFVMCGGATNAAPTTAPTIGTTGGQTAVTPTITMNNAAVALTVDQLPAHNHTATATDAGHTHTATQVAHTHTVQGCGAAFAVGYGAGFAHGAPATQTTTSAQPAITVATGYGSISVTVNNAGGGQSHTHANTATSSEVSTMPPYYVLAFICKI